MKRNQRGFKTQTFKELYGADCSIQESSLATKPALWLGMDRGTHVDGNCLARMHVDKKLARKLVKWLNLFIETGEL